jgi:hypothetical protein
MIISEVDLIALGLYQAPLSPDQIPVSTDQIPLSIDQILWSADNGENSNMQSLGTLTKRCMEGAVHNGRPTGNFRNIDGSKYGLAMIIF